MILIPYDREKLPYAFFIEFLGDTNQFCPGNAEIAVVGSLPYALLLDIKRNKWDIIDRSFDLNSLSNHAVLRETLDTLCKFVSHL